MNSLQAGPQDALNRLDYSSDVLLSFCLFNSNHYNPKKHLDPFLKFIEKGTDNDVVVFAAKDMIGQLAPVSSKIHIIPVPQYPHYSNHLTRYFAAAAPHKTVIFCGMDTPQPCAYIEKGLELQRLIPGIEFIARIPERAKQDRISGHCAFVDGRPKRMRFVDILINTQLTDQWCCDERFLFEWLKNVDVSSYLGCAQGLHKESSKNLVLEKLKFGRAIISNM